MRKRLPSSSFRLPWMCLEGIPTLVDHTAIPRPALSMYDYIVHLTTSTTALAGWRADEPQHRYHRTMSGPHNISACRGYDNIRRRQASYRCGPLRYLPLQGREIQPELPPARNGQPDPLFLSSIPMGLYRGACSMDHHVASLEDTCTMKPGRESSQLVAQHTTAQPLYASSSSCNKPHVLSSNRRAVRPTSNTTESSTHDQRKEEKDQMTRGIFFFFFCRLTSKNIQNSNVDRPGT